ncbi:hypothetical protein BDV59DRAFT_203598 [Aspergillus ambiguus]|uniref:uncharacterized protein n=1 Tax=Aspergillus ambiguus TaxID=176160 RepID=UPI003CCD4F3D
MYSQPNLPPGYAIHEGYPTVPAYLYLRSTAGLSPRSTPQATAALEGSWYGCYITYNASIAPTNSADTPEAFKGDTVVAMGRIIGDGGWYFHIADMAVLPDHQRRGLGDAVLKTLIEKIRSVAPIGPDPEYAGNASATSFTPYVTLMADEPGRKLYARNGFVYTAPHSLGMMLPWATAGTHGTGKQHKNIATQIIGLRVLDAQGNIHVIDNNHNPELLNAFRISIGALGIITEVTIQAEPLSYLKRTSKVVQLPSNTTELYQSIAEIGEKYEQINILGPSLNWDMEKQDLVLKNEATLVYWEETDFSAVQNCSMDYCANDCGLCDRNYHCYDYKMDAVATPPPGVCYRGFMGQFEHFLPIEYLADAGRDYLDYAMSQAERMKPHFNTILDGESSHGYVSDEVTVITLFMRADENWLSALNHYSLPENASGVFAALEYSWVPPFNNFTTQWFHQELAREFIPTFGEEYNVRPHWNKMIFHDESYSSTIFPKMEDWLAVQETMDPKCQFVNDFLVESLGIERCRHLFQ